MEYSYLIAMAVGFLGGVHCVGMCGGIVGILSFSIEPDRRDSFRKSFPYLAAYNLGRLFSYTLAGALAGGFGSLITEAFTIRYLQGWLQLVAGIFMILLGLYIGGWWRVLLKLEQAGSLVWQRLEPIGRKFLPVKSTRHALLLGMVWGWLPCGLVYSVLIWALFSTSAQQGAMLMLSFGIGTLPNLLAMGLFASFIQKFVREDWVRHLAGVLIILFGIYSFYLAFNIFTD